MKFRNLALAAAAAALFAFATFAQVVTLEGNVIGEDGKPLQGAIIKLQRTDIKANYQTKSDKKGHWLHAGLPLGGTFTITCEVNGKEMDKVNGVRTQGQIQPVDFDLSKLKASQAQQQQALQHAADTGQVSKELERGMTKEQKEALDKAMKQREEQMKKNSALNQAFNEGMTALQAKQWDQAVAALTKAGEVDPNQMAVWAQLAEAYMGQAQGKTGAEFEQATTKAQEAYQKALALKPDDAALHNNYGRALANSRKFPEAQAEMKKAAELDPTNAGRYYYNLGALLVNAGQTDPAAEMFKKAIDTDPNYADAYYQYGITLMGKANLDQATGKVTPAPGTVEAFQKYLELQPTGTYSQQAKDMLTTLGGSVETNFKNPNAKQDSKKTTKKKQ
ncbi:MAG TPA: tetratricopeptide repeat protein [Bryobacteraceae bacterium]|jgi:Tfp pilus assembly protein PilF